MQGLTHSALDVKVVSCDVCGELMSPSDRLLVGTLPHLLTNYKEKNTTVKSAAETAIANLIQGDTHLKVQQIFCPQTDGIFVSEW